MAEFSFRVDTDPMAKSVDQVSRHVNLTTEAVAAMQSAVILSQQQAADEICDNVDRGFFYLIRSQVTTKMAENFSVLSAKLVSLMEMGKALTAQKDRMESDVARLQREYAKTFNSLNRALERRVFELDKYAAKLAQDKKSLITDRLLKQVSESVFYERDTSSTARMAFTARIRNKTSKALMDIGNNITENETYKSRLASILEEQHEADSSEECIPVMYVVQSSMSAQNATISKVFLPEGLADGSQKDAIESMISREINELSEYEKSEEELDRIWDEFYSYADAAGLDERVYQTMCDLLQDGGQS